MGSLKSGQSGWLREMLLPAAKLSVSPFMYLCLFLPKILLLTLAGYILPSPFTIPHLIRASWYLDIRLNHFLNDINHMVKISTETS